jgi:hypothetical protein
MRMLERKNFPEHTGIGRAAIPRWLAAALAVWLLAMQAPLPLVHFACLADGGPAAACLERPPRWDSHPPAEAGHDASHCLICQAFCQLLRLLVPEHTGCQLRPIESPSLAHPATTPPAKAPCLALAGSRAPPALS